MKDKLVTKRYALISLFLALEVMLFIALDFAGAGTILRVLALLIVGVLAPVFWEELRLDLGKGLYILLMPLFIYGVVTILAPAYTSVAGGPGSNETLMGLSLFTRIVNGLSLVVILLLGYFVRKSGVFQAKHVYILLLAGFSVPIAISLFATIINYGFFHTLIYRGYVNFYNGVAYPVATQASYLVGFKIMTVDINILKNSALLILSGAFSLLFFKKDHDKFEFIATAIISGLGLLTLLLTGSFSVLLYLLPAALFALLLRFNLLQKLNHKITLYVVLGVFGLGLILFTLTAFNALNIVALWQSNSLLRKVFYNSKMIKFYEVFRFSFANGNLFGEYSNWTDTTLVFPTGSFIFDILWTDGIVGFLAFLGFLGLFISLFIRHFQKSSDKKGFKVLLSGLFLTLLFRYVLSYPFHHYTYIEYRAIDNFPFTSSPIFLIVVFFAGYLFPHDNGEVLGHEEK